jgi:hypothetical protein
MIHLGDFVPAEPPLRALSRGPLLIPAPFARSRIDWRLVRPHADRFIFSVVCGRRGRRNRKWPLAGLSFIQSPSAGAADGDRCDPRDIAAFRAALSLE